MRGTRPGCIMEQDCPRVRREQAVSRARVSRRSTGAKEATIETEHDRGRSGRIAA